MLLFQKKMFVLMKVWFLLGADLLSNNILKIRDINLVLNYLSCVAKMVTYTFDLKVYCGKEELNKDSSIPTKVVMQFM
jgi:hypothetical protein